MGIIFVRHRQHIKQGSGQPRFAIVAVQGANLKVFRYHVRRAELEAIASKIDAELVFLPRGEHADEPVDKCRQGKRTRKKEKEKKKKKKS